MDKEEIEKKAKEVYDNPLAHANKSCEMLYEQHCKDFTKGAEWMQEQTIEQARNAFCRYCQFDCEGHPHDDCTLLQEYVQTIKGEK